MEKLKLHKIRKVIPHKIQIGTYMDYIKDLAENKYNDDIDYDVYLPSIGKNLQRPFVWTLEQKQELILSVLKDIEILSISIIVYKEKSSHSKATYKIIDGKQRLSTLIRFYKGEFPIVFDNNKYYFNDLEASAQRTISLLTLKSNRIYEYSDHLVSDQDKITWFEMINFTGTPQDKEHLKSLK